MKSSQWRVICMCLLLLASITFVQLCVDMFYAQRYAEVLLYSGLAVIVVPVASFIYSLDKRR
ncbi:hypothetical protein O0555_01185 [Brevibacillus laterosporus]|uniref:hypothetical protein n=1 Tax=Brevibacillus laterosporus TaxID=1465 RepID=UPI0018CDC68E|nr:hypothetical protein [Brevibacillus laterosporus]MBG9774810.1 hypothetical protein [Brevibacillus laterosporus]MBG9798825.1 hypothetical protein [Brevibacillus laterosporus]MCR8935974.1 hypothetical protein [Brevibacillus laterosporus]MCZ0838613.1 hypothetical protein [Brevibacillus laterosporus]MCZ0843228.1 hypothetical protein [Brevibacillus laterosporus]